MTETIETRATLTADPLSEEMGLEELASFIKSYGRRNIAVASEILPEADS